MFQIFISIILMAISTIASANSSLSFGPFQGVDLSALSVSHRETIAQASEDFDLVQKGKKPKYATVDSKAPLPADGGTSYFIGKGYRLTVVKSISTFGRDQRALNGLVYGPIISFSKSFALGNSSDVVGLRFYTAKQFQQLTSSE
jgi:hypothetical protein